MNNITRIAAWLEDAAADGLTSASPGDQHNFKVAATRLRKLGEACTQVAERLEAWACKHDNLSKHENDAERSKVQIHKRDNYLFLAHILRSACRVDSNANSTNVQGAQVSSPVADLPK